MHFEQTRVRIQQNPGWSEVLFQHFNISLQTFAVITNSLTCMQNLLMFREIIETRVIHYIVEGVRGIRKLKNNFVEKILDLRIHQCLKLYMHTDLIPIQTRV